MKQVFWILALASVLLVAACGSGGERGDPLVANQQTTDLGGSVYSGSNLANEMITEENQYDFCENLFWQLYLSDQKAANLVGSTTGFDTVRITGNISGHAQVQILSMVIVPPQKIDVELIDSTVFNDYSDDGRLYMGGKLEFKGLWRDIDGKMVPLKLQVSGKLKFAGIYQGEAEFSGFSIQINDDGTLLEPGVPVTGIPLSGSLRIRYGDERFYVYPYPFLIGPG